MNNLPLYQQLLIALALVQGFFLACPTIIIKAKPGSRLYKWLGTRNATNRPCLIIIKSDLNHAIPILCQEWGEQEEGRFLLRGIRNKLSKEAGRRLETLYKEVEVQAAVILDGVNEDEYRYSEAQSLTRYSQFEGFSVEAITSRMKQVKPEAIDRFYELYKIKRIKNYEA